MDLAVYVIAFLLVVFSVVALLENINDWNDFGFQYNRVGNILLSSLVLVYVFLSLLLLRS